MATDVGGFESDSEGRQTKKRDAHEARTPGRHANTDALAGNGVPQPKVPGKRSGTEHLAPLSESGRSRQVRVELRVRRSRRTAHGADNNDGCACSGEPTCAGSTRTGDGSRLSRRYVGQKREWRDAPG